jgi:hypothetical protein
MGNGVNRGDYYKRLARQREKLFGKLSAIIIGLHMVDAPICTIMRVVRVAKAVERSMRVYQIMSLLEEI